MGTRGSSQLNGQEADVSTILGTKFRCGKKRLVVVLPVGARAPPLSSLSGRVRDRTSEGGEIKRLTRASLLVTFIYLLSMLSSPFASHDLHPPSFSHFVRKTGPFEIKETPSLTPSVPLHSFLLVSIALLDLLTLYSSLCPLTTGWPSPKLL
jgi:hypothetical protein